MMNRSPIPKGVRFDVLNRDRFTCQYCGRSAPDVVLHVDHITPISDGGTDDLINLVTACSSCNNGKSDKGLNPGSQIAKELKWSRLLQDSRQSLGIKQDFYEDTIIEIDDILNAIWGHRLNDDLKDIVKTELVVSTPHNTCIRIVKNMCEKSESLLHFMCLLLATLDGTETGVTDGASKESDR